MFASHANADATHAPGRRVAIVFFGFYPSHPHVRRDVRALHEAGFDVDVICARRTNQPIYERLDGVTVLRVPIGRKRSGPLRYAFEYAAFPLLAAVVTAFRGFRRRYAYVEIDNMPDWLVLAAVIPKLLGAKVIFYTFENMPSLVASDRNLPADHPLVSALTQLERICAAVADRVIAPHEMIRRILIHQGIPDEKIVVVPNAPDERLFLSSMLREPKTNASLDKRSQDQRSGDTFRLVTHGQLLKRYGIETLIEAAEILQNSIPGLRLDIIGRGEFRNELERHVARLHLSDVVTFRGYIPFDEIASTLVEADIGVVPAWADHLLPNKLVEYLALGLPVITTDFPALRLYFSDNDVYYVKAKDPKALADAILDLYSHPNRRSALGQAGNRAFRDKIAWQQNREMYLSMYDATPYPGSDNRNGSFLEGGAPHEKRARGWLSFVLSESRGPRNMVARLPTILSRFGISARKSERELAALLEVTHRYGARPTLPVTAMTARRNPQVIRWLVEHGVELAGHGYVHNDYAALSAQEQVEQVRLTRQELAMLGVHIRGWRCPYFRWNADTLSALRTNGFEYDSTTVFAWPVFEQEHIPVPAAAEADYRRLCTLFSARDATHHIVLPSILDGLVEIPAALPQDEDMVDRLHLDTDTMSRIWCRILNEVRRRGEIFVINLHPERATLCAEPLAATLSMARDQGDVWIATLGEVADWWRERNEAQVTLERHDGQWQASIEGPDRLKAVCKEASLTGAGVLLTEESSKPVIQCGSAWSRIVRQRLRDAGYLTERGNGAIYALDLDRELPPDTSPDQAVRFVQDHDMHLLRLAPWPAGYVSAISVTGDIDALTLIDFAMRLKEF